MATILMNPRNTEEIESDMLQQVYTELQRVANESPTPVVFVVEYMPERECFQIRPNNDSVTRMYAAKPVFLFLHGTLVETLDMMLGLDLADRTIH